MFEVTFKANGKQKVIHVVADNIVDCLSKVRDNYPSGSYDTWGTDDIVSIIQTVSSDIEVLK